MKNFRGVVWLICLLFGGVIGFGAHEFTDRAGAAMHGVRKRIPGHEAFSTDGVVATNALCGHAFDVAAKRLGAALNLADPVSTTGAPDQGVWFTSCMQERANLHPHYCVYANNFNIFIVATDATEADRAVDALLGSLTNPFKVKAGKLIHPFVLTNLPNGSKP